MFFTKRNHKLIMITFFLLFICSFFVETAIGESVVSDATVEVVQESEMGTVEFAVKQGTLPKTNEQLNGLLTCIGIVLICCWLKLFYPRIQKR